MTTPFDASGIPGAPSQVSPDDGETRRAAGRAPAQPDAPVVYCDMAGESGDEERQLAAVMEIASVINSQLDLHQILSAISKELSKVIDYDLGCVAIYDPDMNGLFMRHVWRRCGGTTGEGRYVPLDDSNLVGWVALHKKPVLRGDIAGDRRFREIMKEDGLQSDIVVPLVAKNALIGTVNVGSYQRDHFSDFDLDLVVRFGQLTSIAIEKCQLLQEVADLGEKYRLVMNNANDVIALLNAQGQVVECNRVMCELSGYEPAEFMGKDFFLLAAPDRRDEAKRNFMRVLRGEVTRISDVSYRKKNGETLHVEISGSVIRIKDNPYVIAIAHDITERKRLQERIVEQNAELTEINRKLRDLDDLKNEFLGRISHELRTPLSVIMAYTGTLLEDRGQTIDPETRTEFLRVIDGHSNKLLGLINDLLDLSRVEVSQTMLHQSEGSLNDVVKISMRIAGAFAEQSRVRLEADLDDTVPIMSFDPLRVRQTCVNLINNAIKFSREGDVVTVRTRNGVGEAVVSVEDHGPGIPSEEMSLLFEKFTQLDGGAARERDGLGIGLKLVKHYVELHGGRVWVTSEPGSGSTFSFSIPRQMTKE